MNLTQPQIDSLLEGNKELNDLQESVHKKSKYKSKYKKDDDGADNKKNIVDNLTKLMGSGMNISDKAKEKISKILKQKAKERKDASNIS